MDGRRHIPPDLGGRIVQASGLIQHGQFPPGHWPLDRLVPPDHLENKVAAQAAEIEQLAGDNHRLASTHVPLRQDLSAAQQEVERLRAHMKSIHTESDIQIRLLLDKISKMESEIGVSENVKEDLEQARLEAQSLVKAGQELTSQIQQASLELQKVHADVKTLPDLQAERENLRNEYKRVRAIFEHEKGLNIAKVEELKAKEQNLIGMARELEKLHAQLLCADKGVHAPNMYGGGYAAPDPSYPHPVHGTAPYVDAYRRPLVQMGVGPAVNGMVPYSSSSNGVVVSGGIGGTGDSGVGGAAVWRGSYEPSPAQKST